MEELTRGIKVLWGNKIPRVGRKSILAGRFYLNNEKTMKKKKERTERSFSS